MVSTMTHFLDKVKYSFTSTPFGDLITSRTASQIPVAVVYCHGAFGEGDAFDYSGVALLADSGFTVCLIRYGLASNIPADTNRTAAAINAFKIQGFPYVFLIGISRGGFVVYSTLQNSLARHFITAAVICVGPTELVSWQQQTSVPQPNLTNIMKYFNWTGDLAQSSPLMNAEQLRDLSMLLVYGQDDKVVPVDQGIRMAASINGPTSRSATLYTLAGAGHNLADDSRVQKLIIAWILQHLKGEIA